MNTRKIILFFCLCFPAGTAFGQLSIEECYIRAKENYPLIRKYELIEKTRQYNLSNLSKGYLPQLSVSGSATYQNDITSFPIDLPGVDMPTLTKDQYQIKAELNQTIWDGGAISAQKKYVSEQSEVEKQKVTVDLYALNQRINDLFFGILLLDEQLQQNDLYLQELERNHTQISSFIRNGVANESDLDPIKVEQLNTRQQQVALKASRKAFTDMLSAMVGKNIENVPLTKPDSDILFFEGIRRPELKLFEQQSAANERYKKVIDAKVMPRIGLFANGGYGKPGLNMLSNEFAPIGIAGVKISWNIGSFYTRRNELAQIGIDRRNIENQRDVFLFNTNLEVLKEQSEIQKWKETLSQDDAIISLRESIRRSAEAKVANGTMSVLDYMREVNAAQQSKQAKIIHEVELLMSVYSLRNTTNN